MRRRLLNLLTILSLLLCVAVCVLWVRSYWVSDRLALNAYRLRQLGVAGGGVFFQSVEFVHRAGEWEAKPPQAGPPPPLTGYKETTGSYVEWRKAKGDAPRRWQWESGPAGRLPPGFIVSLALSGPPRPPGRRIRPGTEQVSHVSYVIQSFRESKVDGTFRLESKTEEQVLTGWTLWLPFWPLAVLTALLPAARLVGAWSARSRSHRRRTGLCPSCGYDLRASPGRCPECGAEPAPRPGRRREPAAPEARPVAGGEG